MTLKVDEMTQAFQSTCLSGFSLFSGLSGSISQNLLHLNSYLIKKKWVYERPTGRYKTYEGIACDKFGDYL
jgi:hypothetical protein